MNEQYELVGRWDRQCKFLLYYIAESFILKRTDSVQIGHSRSTVGVAEAIPVPLQSGIDA